MVLLVSGIYCVAQSAYAGLTKGLKYLGGILEDINEDEDMVRPE